MICIHCGQSFRHKACKLYWCSPECWDQARATTWAIVPHGPTPLGDRGIRLGIRARPKRRNQYYPVTDAERGAIIARLARGMKHRRIAEILNVSLSTISKIKAEVSSAAGRA